MTFYFTQHLSQEASLPEPVKTEIKPRHKILDIGCGNGALKKLFPQNTLVGIDKLAERNPCLEYANAERPGERRNNR